MPRGVYERAPKVDPKQELKPVLKQTVETTIEPEIVDGNVCLGCNHEKEKHYGSKKLWCNFINCQCKALK